MSVLGEASLFEDRPSVVEMLTGRRWRDSSLFESIENIFVIVWFILAVCGVFVFSYWWNFFRSVLVFVLLRGADFGR